MKQLAIHSGVLLLLLVAAYGVSYLLPPDMSAKLPFRGAILLFMIYLAASFILPAIRKRSAPPKASDEAA